MKLLVHPAVVALLASLLAAGVHPRFRGLTTEAGAVGFTAMALLLAVAYAARAFRGGLAERVQALGAAALVVGLALDGTRAHRGMMTLGLGQSKNTFEEQDAAGRSLGFRPLGREVQLIRANGTEATLALSPSGEVTLTAARAARVGAFRLGEPQLRPTGEAARITLTATDDSGVQTVELGGGRTGRLGDLEIELERYFPDFALDDRQKPFTRSDYSRNPAALLQIRRGERTFRVFVIRAMPGLHQVAELRKTFGLAAVEPELSVQIRVAREPFAPLIGAGAMALLAAVALGRSPA